MILFDIFRNIFLAPLELIFESIFTIAYNITNSEYNYFIYTINSKLYYKLLYRK